MANKLSESFELLTSISPKGIPLGEDFFIVLQSSLLMVEFFVALKNQSPQNKIFYDR
jgi:hypothetical protein